MPNSKDPKKAKQLAIILVIVLVASRVLTYVIKKLNAGNEARYKAALENTDSTNIIIKIQQSLPSAFSNSALWIVVVVAIIAVYLIVKKIKSKKKSEEFKF